VAPVERAFLGVEPSGQFRLSDRLINFDASKAKSPLMAPTPVKIGAVLRWATIPGATGYVVERRDAQSTLLPTTQEMYRGEKTSYLVPDESHKYASATFHVKATGGVFRPDRRGPDGDHVVGGRRIDRLHPRAPGVDVRVGRSAHTGWKSIYDGPLTKYYDLGRISGGLYTYRVKALGRWGQTAWSEQVNG
jgi:hypothetical protein